MTPTTPGDASRIASIRARGLEALRRIKGEATWEDWMMIGAAMMTFTEDAMTDVGATEWDEDNRKLHKAFMRRWGEYEASDSSNQKPLSKQERWALRYVMTHPEVGAWRAEMGIKDAFKMRKINHPNKVIEAYKRAHPEPGNERGVSPFAKLKQENIALQEELHRLKRAGDDNRFLPQDTAKGVAGSIVRMFTPSKATTIAKEILALVKAQAEGKAEGDTASTPARARRKKSAG